MKGWVLAIIGSSAAACAVLGDIQEKELTATGQDAGADTGTLDANDASEVPDVSSQPGYLDLDRPGRPPSRPSKPAAGPGKLMYFAMRRIYFGISKRGTAERDPNAWRAIGWDLDGLATTKQELDDGKAKTCKSSGESNVLQDGFDGRDNALGASLMQFIGNADANGEHVANQSIESGTATLLLVLGDVNDVENDPHVNGAVYLSTSDKGLPTAPKWDGTDVRQVWNASMFTDTINTTASFPDGYIRDGVWVSGDQHKADMTLVFPIYVNAYPIPMVLQLAGRSGWLTAAVKKGAGGPGTFGFTMTAEQLYGTFFPLFKRVLGCDSPVGTTHGLVSGFKSNVDVQGSNAWAPDPNLGCDSVSWGLDVEWAPIAYADWQHPVAAESTPPCAGPGP
ncbi:MAG: hypothetical protein L6Q84_08450 [Polyangiaceae bacterium]|nr:hypothetical protein [Polyangiaceae bacterium]